MMFLNASLRRFFFKGVCIFITVTLLAGCGGGFENIGNAQGGDAVSSDAQDFIGSGRWQFSLDDDNDFLLIQNDDDDEEVLRISGEATRQNSGLLRLTVEDASGDTRLEDDDDFYLLQISERLVIFADPDRRSTPVRYLIREGDCPISDFSGHWIATFSEDDPQNTESDFFGGFEFDASDDELSLLSIFALDSIDEFDSQGTQNFSTEECNDSLVQLRDSNIYLNRDSVAIIDEEDETFFLLNSGALSAISDLDSSDYIGFIFDRAASSGARNDIIAASCVSTSGCDLFRVSDEDSGSREAQRFAFVTWQEQINQPVNGQLSGTLSMFDEDNMQQDANALCSFDNDLFDQGDKFLVCVSQSPLDQNDMVNFVLFSD